VALKLEAAPFYGILVGLVAGGAWFIFHYEFFRFSDPKAKQFCAPAIDEGMQRLGRDMTWLREDDVQIGDHVRFRTGRTTSDTTSRVIALAGQRVAIQAGKLWIDGAEVQDPWGKRNNANDWTPEIAVPPGCVYVLNDQRWAGGSDRNDSRTLGPIPLRAIEYVFPPKDAE
jgi:signal peptidase I